MYSRPFVPAYEDIFEQIMNFTLSEDYLKTKRYINILIKEK